MDDLLIHQDGALLRLTINRPADGNQVTTGMAAQLAELLGTAAKSSRLVLLSAAGDDFSNGWKGPSGGLPHDGGTEALEARERFDVIFDCYAAFRRARIPIVGAVQGRARGFGCAVAALCDITVAADTATFQVPELSFNVLPTMVMSSLVDRVPAKALSYLVYTTEEIDAHAALQCGIVSRIVPQAALTEHVERICGDMLRRPAPALPAVKEYVGSAPRMDINGAVDFARSLHAMVNTSSRMKPTH